MDKLQTSSTSEHQTSVTHFLNPKNHNHWRRKQQKSPVKTKFCYKSLLFIRKHDARSIHCWIKREQNVGQWFFLRAGSTQLSAGSGLAPAPSLCEAQRQSAISQVETRDQASGDQDLGQVHLTWGAADAMSFFVWAGDDHDKLRPEEESCDRQKHVSRVQRLGPDSYRVQPLNCDWAHYCKMSASCLDWPNTVYYWVHWPIRGLQNTLSGLSVSGTSDICTQSVWSHHLCAFVCDIASPSLLCLRSILAQK